MNSIFIQKKEVMWSALNDGFSIDVNNRGLFALYMQDIFEHGFKSQAIIMIDVEEFEVRLSNKMFVPQKFEHADQFFVNYGRQSGFAKKMRRNHTFLSSSISPLMITFNSRKAYRYLTK